MSKLNFIFQSLVGILVINSLLVLSPVFAQSLPLGQNQQPQNVGISSNVSENWAGYVATAGNYTEISGSWNVPSVSASNAANTSADATWVGIGGVSTTDLIQAGTQAIIQNGQIQYQPWYEILPNAAINVPLSIKAGDSISIAISETSTNQWQIIFKNNTTGQSYTQDVNYTSTHSSAEWIEEMPMEFSSGRLLSLDNFGTIFISNGQTVQNGNTLNIGSAGGQPLSMATRGGILLASPSSLDNGNSFSITRSSNQAIPTTSVSTSPSIRVIRVSWSRGGDNGHTESYTGGTRSSYTVSTGSPQAIYRIQRQFMRSFLNQFSNQFNRVSFREVRLR